MSSLYYKNQKYTGPTLDLGSGSLTTDDKTIVGAINELDAKCAVVKYAVVEGTFSATASAWSDTVAFPTGFTNTNSTIAGFSIKVDANNWRTGVGIMSDNAVRVFAELSCYGVRAYSTDSNFVSRPFRVVLVKTN